MRDPLAIVPPHIKARYESEEFVDRAAKAGRSLEAHLKATVDSALEVVFVRHDIDPEVLPNNAVAGRWHVRRKNPMPELPTYMPILAPGGGYRDPDSGVPAELAERDLRRPGVLEREIQRGRVDSPQKAREKALQTEQRRDEMLSDFKTAKRLTEGSLEDSYVSRTKHKRKMKAA